MVCQTQLSLHHSVIAGHAWADTGPHGMTIVQISGHASTIETQNNHLLKVLSASVCSLLDLMTSFVLLADPYALMATSPQQLQTPQHSRAHLQEDQGIACGPSELLVEEFAWPW